MVYKSHKFQELYSNCEVIFAKGYSPIVKDVTEQTCVIFIQDTKGVVDYPPYVSKLIWSNPSNFLKSKQGTMSHKNKK